MSKQKIQRLRGASLTALLCGLWIVMVIAGFWCLLRYEAQPGARAHLQSASWPPHSTLSPASGVFNLVMFVHPKCPCTSASISELAILMTQCHDLRSQVVCLKPDCFNIGWEKGAHWYRAISIPGVTVVSDSGGHIAEQFGATTSGEVFLYTPDGRLVFSGGITAGRGHEGDNQGVDIIKAIISKSEKAVPPNTPVYGCSLSSKPSSAREFVNLCRR